MSTSWLSLVPPLMVIAFIVVTRRLNFSLICGISAAALIVADGNIVLAISLCFKKLVAHCASIENIYLYLFLIVISSLIVLLTVTGSATGFADFMGKKIKTKRSFELFTVLFSVLLSIDDYLSILTVGFVMRPIADRLTVARIKLAYIIHALAGPLVIIIPISTWAAAILVQLDNAGIHSGAMSKIMADPFYVYLKTVPFVFYSLLTFVAVMIIVCTKINFGQFSAHAQAVSLPNVIHDECNESLSSHSVLELVIPIMLLMSGVLFGILYAGGWHCFGGSHSFIDAFRHNNQTFLVLLLSGIMAFCFSVAFSLYNKMILVGQLFTVVREGFVLIKSSIVMVILSSILGAFLGADLSTGSYVAYLLFGIAPLCLMPVILFVVSLLITLVTGSAWGTFSLLIPIAVQMLISFLQLEAPVEMSQIAILFPSLGAVLSGAACGNHLAPFAETTIMTAASAGVEPLEHARTQLVYAIPVVLGTMVAFVFSGLLCGVDLWINSLVSLCSGLITIGCILYVENRFLR